MAEYLQAKKERPKKPYVHPGTKLFGNRYAGTRLH
jgi:hypothetical protein